MILQVDPHKIVCLRNVEVLVSNTLEKGPCVSLAVWAISACALEFCLVLRACLKKVEVTFIFKILPSQIGTNEKAVLRVGCLLDLLHKSR